jgi:chromosome segregation protein
VKFERLRLAGFKTFVDPTDIAIAPGLTGVVGPNGCGKSNLVEALRWVMGETSSKSLRGGGMDDVIFAGSNTRPERSHAEVSIRIGAPPADLPGHLAGADQLDISRRIVREQGSTYRINGREVRARDVQILFADAASGARSPSMVRQGQIGELIAAKPQHRRRILEDAAGIAGLHARRHEAELRLRQAEDNLTRTEDVLGQLDRQIGDLRKQAKQAQRFKALQAEIRALELRQLAASLDLAAREAEAARRENDLAVRAIAAATIRQGETERARAVAEHEAEALRQRAAEAGARHQSLVVARETLDNEIRLAETRIAEIAARRGELDRDRAAAARMLGDADAAAIRLAEEAEALAARIAAEMAEQAGDAERRAEAEAARGRAEAAFAEAQRAEAEKEADRRAAEQRLAEAESRLARLEGAEAQARRELGGLEAGDPGLQRLAALEREAEARLAAYDQALAAAEAAENAARAARAAEQTERPRLAEAERLLQRLETEARTIRKLVDQAEPGLWTPAIDRIRVAPGYETALAAALGEDLEAALEPGAARHWDDAAIEAAGLPTLPEGAEPALNHVEAPAALHPRLSQIGIVTREQGLALRRHLRQGQRLVTREGDLWRWDGFTARAEAPSAAARRLAERNRLAEIEAHAAEARRKRDEVRARIDQLAGQNRKAEADSLAARDAARRAGGARDAAQAEFQRETRRTEEARLRLEALRNRITALAADCAEALSHAETARAARAAFPERQAENPLAGLAAALAEARRAEQTARDTESQRAARLAAARERGAAIGREQAAWAERITRARQQDADQAERHARLAAEAERLAALPAELGLRRRTIEAETATAAQERQMAEDARAEGEATLRRVDEAARGAMTALADAREAAARLDAHRQNAGEKHAHVIRAIEERIEAPVATLAERIAALDGPVIVDPDAIERRLQDLRGDRDRLGAVNLRADTELAEIEGERTMLDREREDVLAAIRKFRRAIDQLNAEGRSRLQAAFGVVDGHFRRLFERLFGGGAAELQLVEAEDPLESGLEIIAKPPGKKPQLLSLLSGGEQALTATALIFAVFLTNPAPICVLDEVDAPLDDSNVERLCDLLRDMARETETRFLVITHNPISMARMDRLYGVTMVERGVSQVVSVDLAAAERLAEAV